MTVGLDTIQNNVVIDGEDRNIILQYTTNFAGCSQGTMESTALPLVISEDATASSGT